MMEIYLACLVVAVGLYVWLFVTDVKNSINQKLLIFTLIVSYVGSLCRGVATDMGEAILTQKIIYFGSIFLPMLYFFSVCEICRFQLNKVVKFILVVLQIGLFGMVCTIGYSGLYYKKVSFEVVGKYGHLIKEYAPAHILYPAMLYLYFFITVLVIIFFGLKNKKLNRRQVWGMLVCCLLSVCGYIFKFMMPLTQLAPVIGALIPMYDTNLFNVEENKNIIKEELGKVGFITFNRRKEYMGCNEYAAQLFPELRNYEVGRKVKNCGKELEQLLSELESEDTEMKKEKFSLPYEGRYFDVEIYSIRNCLGKCVGWTLELTDVTEHRRMIELTTQYNETLEKEVEEKTETIHMIQRKLLIGMAQMVESRDLSTGGHIKRTSDVVEIFAKKLLQSNMGFDKKFLKWVVRSAPMHDLGKIGVRDAILQKQGKFTEEEYAQMKEHAAIGGKMVGDILTGVENPSFVQIAKNVAQYHHEKVDGTGYPEGISGEKIPVEARIMALADVFDALVSKRCYKEAFSYEKAFHIIETDAGSHFDKKLAEVFLSCREELIDYYNHCER